MPLAGNVSLVTVTGTYVDYQGNPMAGQIIFQVPKALRNALADQILVPSSFFATLDANGQFSATLPATDDVDFHETFTYTVTESFVGGRTFSMVLPSSPASQDMADLSPVPSITQFVALASFANYVQLEQRVTAAEANVDTTPPVTGITLALQYVSLPIAYLTYADMASNGVSYGNVATVPAVATSAAIGAYATTIQGFASQAQAAQALAEAAEVRDPHPFVFTGAA